LNAPAPLWYNLTMQSLSPLAFQAAFFRRCPTAETVMALFDSLPNVAFYAKDTRSRYVRVNARCVAIHAAKSEADMLGRDDRAFHPPAMAAAYIAEDGRVMASRRALPGQVWLVFHQSQLPHWYVSTKVPLLDSKGAVLGIAGAMYEIERPHEEQQFFQELSPVIRHIEQNFAAAVSMPEMAALAGLSSTHFNRRFQQLLRMTPTGYLRWVRIQAACHLLSTTRRALADIAASTGFSDQSHFTRRFRQSTGITPTVFRQRFQQSK